MAEQPAVNIGPPGDNYSNWLNIAKDQIKETEEKDALKRIETIKKLITKSVNDTLLELKLGKYQGKIRYFNKISENEVVNKLKNEWDILKLNEWKGPINDI
eukprot:UN11344